MDLLNADPDIRDEALALSKLSLGRQPAETLKPAAKMRSAPSRLSNLLLGRRPAETLKPAAKVPSAPITLNVVRSTHQPSAHTVALLTEAGGLPALRRFTNDFYSKAFLDPHLDQLIRDHNDPHGERFASWIAEKMGHGTPWTAERRTRPVCPFHAPGVGDIDVHDRSSAHFAAWHSPKRDPEDFGKHFNLHDSRIWMRLHFWAAREQGLFEHKAFADYYVRLIGHFVSVYERQAPPFARESARWSADVSNIERYLADSRVMTDLAKLKTKSPAQVLATLPKAEQPYHGSGDAMRTWPYEVPTSWEV